MTIERFLVDVAVGSAIGALWSFARGFVRAWRRNRPGRDAE